MRKGLAIAVGVGLLAAGCGSGGGSATRRVHSRLDESAAKFAVHIQAQLKSGRFAQAWRTLHPAERRVISSARLSSCYPRNEFPGAVTFRARKVRDVRWTVPGGQTTDAKAVTIGVTSPGRPKEMFTQHVVRVRGTWAWMLSSAYFKQARNGTC